MKTAAVAFSIAAVASVASASVLPERLSNAERFSRGLGPKAPLRRFDPTRTGSRRATTSATPAGTASSVCNAPSSYPLSCTADANASGDTCCDTYPGGHLLQTQFWDTEAPKDNSTGPSNSWTIHGLWPDNCDGTYQQYCDASREVTNITAILTAAGATDTLSYMQTYWKDYTGDDETFWEHEFNKHATCISSLDPSCFKSFTPQLDVVTFFQRTVGLFETLPTYDWLTQAGIVPSLTQTYTLSQIQAALGAHFSGGININCEDTNVFDEVWYHYESQGSVIDGNFVPAPLVGGASTCPSTGIYWYPKYTTIPTQSTGTGSSSTSNNTGKGYIYAVNADGTTTANTCIISGGTDFAAGTCATFTLSASVAGTSIVSSKGTCGVELSSNTASPSLFDCPTTSSNVDFTVDASTGIISLGGSSAFSMDAIPTTSANKVNVYHDSLHALPITLKFVPGTN